MSLAPPFLLAGLSSFAAPFALTIGGLAAGRLEPAPLQLVRRFALLSWGLLSVGLTLGMWWAYHVLGWGGYWGWDPVENAALMPWLATTAYIPSAQVQERRSPPPAGDLRAFIPPVPLSALGPFLVPSGLLPPV